MKNKEETPYSYPTSMRERCLECDVFVSKAQAKKCHNMGLCFLCPSCLSIFGWDKDAKDL